MVESTSIDNSPEFTSKAHKSYLDVSDSLDFKNDTSFPSGENFTSRAVGPDREGLARTRSSGIPSYCPLGTILAWSLLLNTKEFGKLEQETTVKIRVDKKRICIGSPIIWLRGKI